MFSLDHKPNSKSGVLQPDRSVGTLHCWTRRILYHVIGRPRLGAVHFSTSDSARCMPVQTDWSWQSTQPDVPAAQQITRTAASSA